MCGRLVPRKGQDTLIRALPWIRRVLPDTMLLLVGDGPYAFELRRLALAEGVVNSVVFAGGHPHNALPSFYAAADAFAMPCRTRRRGLEVEGLGIVYLEAAASELPVLAGDSWERLLVVPNPLAAWDSDPLWVAVWDSEPGQVLVSLMAPRESADPFIQLRIGFSMTEEGPELQAERILAAVRRPHPLDGAVVCAGYRECAEEYGIPGLRRWTSESLPPRSALPGLSG